MSEESYRIIDTILSDVLAETPLGEERVIVRDCLEAYRTMRADNERFIARIAEMAEAWYDDDDTDYRDSIVKEAVGGNEEWIAHMKEWPMVFSDEEHEQVEDALALKEFKREYAEKKAARKQEMVDIEAARAAAFAIHNSVEPTMEGGDE